MEKNPKNNIYMFEYEKEFMIYIHTHTYIYAHTHIHIYIWITLLYTRNEYNIINQLYSIKANKENEKKKTIADKAENTEYLRHEKGKIQK